MTPTERRVVKAAMKWFNFGKGYFYRNGYVTSTELARKLEDACAAHKWRGRK
jgi:hypothetical protein